MSALSKSGPLVVGGPPRAELLPPEVAQGVKARALRRSLVVLVVLVIGATVAGVLGVTFLAVGTNALLMDEQKKGYLLLAEQSKYKEVREITTMISMAEEGLELGSATEVKWRDYVTRLQGTLPVGIEITTFAAVTATPTQPYAASTIPLQGDRIGELTFTGSSDALPNVQTWLDSLETLPGYVDATPGSIELDANGRYTVKIVMHVNSEVFKNPYSRAVIEEDTETKEG